MEHAEQNNAGWNLRTFNMKLDMSFIRCGLPISLYYYYYYFIKYILFHKILLELESSSGVKKLIDSNIMLYFSHLTVIIFNFNWVEGRKKHLCEIQLNLTLENI